MAGIARASLASAPMKPGDGGIEGAEVFNWSGRVAVALPPTTAGFWSCP